MRLLASAALSGVIAAVILGGFPSVGVTTASAPQAQQIVRNAIVEEPVDLPAGTYNMVIAELVADPGADTAVHIHPGPTIGFVAEGRLTFSLAGQSSTYSAGSPVHHPWDTPHVMSNRTDARARMYSFELNPIN